MTSPDLTFVAPTGTPHLRPRLEKAIRIASAAGLDVGFWGWRRSPDDPMGADLVPDGERRALSRGGVGRAGRVAGYLRYMMGVFIGALTSPQQRTYWALGLETAAPLSVARLFRKLDYIFDDADRLILTVKIPGPAKPLVAWLERAVARGARAHIVPMTERYDYDFGRFFVIQNSPDRTLIDRSLEIEVAPPPARLLVYASGWMGPSRGSQMIEAAARILKEEGVVFVVATNARDPEAEPLFQLCNVIDLGFVPQAESLAWCRACHVSLTFYDPAVPINRLAAPNKWGDAMVCGRPFITNAEVRTAAPFLSAGAAFAVPWGDANALADLMRQIRDDADLRRASEGAVLALSTDLQPYEARVLELLAAVGLKPAAQPGSAYRDAAMSS